MDKNFEIKKQLDELDYCVMLMVSASIDLDRDGKFDYAEQALIKTYKELSGILADDSPAIPKIKATSAIVYLNTMINKIHTYERIFKKASNEAKRICTCVRDNLDGVTKQVKNDFENKKAMMLDIDSNIRQKFEVSYPKLKEYSYFFDLHPLTKDEFLGLFSFNRDKDKDDGSRANYKGTIEAINDLPDMIDGNAFLQFAATDSVLLNDRALGKFLMHESYEMLKQGGFDIFDMVQDIVGQPLPSFTSTVDELGNITDMKLNRPNLKLV
ncbi:hypothetical protein G7L40_00385 [Paenibacillus polymyxa]|uniref:Uncharacterized protein n=1 Tax=Paenibacillus polymyxa TaxID=1406 RepID=A0A378XUU7_PAEPO|nr:hypothetical protein [Paenibacillus polymyxa]MBE7897167.1 hypothetical protein [Paenibacillus polymyxa]MBG9763024.1 hypothetical protein [Paenibacillus polymyxa]MCC3257584.1 hypothetical protein [Paenibacillus polymyxa]QPK51333.1 hypothetical protein G7035_00385 [Paenibacillus polymyxa]QPK56423.1 hypothetical protein G7L40_00385 [Paenibacillus polymyxa]